MGSVQSLTQVQLKTQDAVFGRYVQTSAGDPRHHGGYINGDKTKEGTRVILGGEWFRETKTGEQNSYLMVEFKNKVFDPLMECVAKHIYENAASLHKLAWLGGGMLAWAMVITTGIAYKLLKGRTGVADSEIRPFHEVRQV